MTALTDETIRAKDASLRLILRRETGFRSTMDCTVSALQWAAINAICEETDEAKVFLDDLAERILKP